MGNLIIQNVGQIASPRPGVFRGAGLKSLAVSGNTSIHIKNGVIESIGPSSEIISHTEDNTPCLDAEKRAVIPSFTDSHSHLVFAGNRADEFARRSAGATYDEIAKQGGGILSTVSATRSASHEDLVALAKERLEKALRQGITTMEIKSGYGLDFATEKKMLEVIQELKESQPVELVSTFLGAHAVPAGSSKEDYLKEIFKMIPEFSGLAEYCDVFCEEGYFSAEECRKILEEGLKHGMLPKIHTNQFHDIGGVSAALEIGAISADHLEVISDHDIRQIAKSNTVATVLPGVSHFLNIPYSPARKLIDEGAIVAIGTDFNPGSSMTLSMQLLMNIACTQMGLSVEETLCCTTQNGAHALQKGNLGCVAPGYQADLLLLDSDSYKDTAYFFGENHVQTVIKKGEIVWQSTK
ncbi:MAG: imidazolonepropionase [Bacteroidetes bacterium]|jgi:imidazolonepropionase|nr:imidazolonepropionase [Bacteroidota bacterium]